ncbi:MAG: single-stranded DNA-binding protein [Cyanobacteria bacterium REEB65]|nr:single-stranded DNA-binding protein [Cyanobacteria bacterium REEB65]
MVAPAKADVSARLIAASLQLRERLAAVCCEGCPGVETIYDPLDYAWQTHRDYLERFGRESPRQVVLVGMNPGPWGMAQTGVPFGDPQFVRDWMGIRGHVQQPRQAHPKRPIVGLDSKRREGSGQRLYGWARDRWGTAERFFADVFVTNYCPLLLLGTGGENITPADLPKRDLAALHEACDAALAEVLSALSPQVAVGVGNYARKRLEEVVRKYKMTIPVGGILHPSPANPQANRGWGETVDRELANLGVAVPHPGQP